MDDGNRMVQAQIQMADFIAQGFIRECEPGRWELTDKGKIEAGKVMSKLSYHDQSLVLLLADNIIRNVPRNE